MLDPGAIDGLPPAIAAYVRDGLAAAMHSVFLAGHPIAAVALVASALIRELPLRDTAYADEHTGSGLPGEPDGGTTNATGSPVLRGRGRKP